MKLQTYMLAFLAFALSLFMLINFMLIWQSGNVKISQPNPMVLLADTLVVLAALVFSLICIARQIFAVMGPRR